MFRLITYNVARGRASLSYKLKSKENTDNCLTIRPQVDRELSVNSFHFLQETMSKLNTQYTDCPNNYSPFLIQGRMFPPALVMSAFKTGGARSRYTRTCTENKVRH